MALAYHTLEVYYLSIGFICEFKNNCTRSSAIIIQIANLITIEFI